MWRQACLVYSWDFSASTSSISGFIMLAVTIVGSLLTLGLAGGVMTLIGIIEGIIYLVKSQTDFEQLYVFNKREWF